MAHARGIQEELARLYLEQLLCGPNPIPQKDGRVPVPQNKPTEYIRKRHREEYAKLKACTSQSIFLPIAPICVPMPASTTPLVDLQQASIRGCYLDEPNMGQYLILRTLERAYMVRSVATIVEDHEGNAALLSFFNLRAEADTKANLDDILPIGTIFIAKEPYITVSNCELTIRIASPADTIFLKEGHELYWMVEDIQWKNPIEAQPDPATRKPKPHSASEWNIRGNELCEEGKISDAIRCYSIALQKASGASGKVGLKDNIRNDLAMCHIKLGQFEAALAHTNVVLKHDPENQKALFRAGRAKYELRQFGQAKGYFETLVKGQPKHEAAGKELERCIARMAEENGTFSMYRVHLENKLRSRQKMDCADYVGPVKMVKIAGKGHGIVATEDVLPGTLLVVSKALAFTWKGKEQVVRMSDEENVVDYGYNQQLITLVTQAITKNPNTFGQPVYDLSIGRHGAEGEGAAAKLFCEPKANKEPIADVERIKKILSTNCFGVFINTRKVDSELDRNLMAFDYGDYYGSGLFLFPSFFNHSCLPNANWQVFNDVMFVRASCAIKTGEEVVLSYFDRATCYEKKQKYFRHYGFQCDCKICEDERIEPEVLRIQKQQMIKVFLEKLLPKIKSKSVTPKAIEDLKKHVEECKKVFRKSGHELRMFTMMHSWLGIAYFTQGSYAEEIDCHLESIRLYGFETDTLAESLKKPSFGDVFQNAFLCQEVLDVIQPLVGALCSLNQDQKMKEWIEILLALEKILSGGDAHVVKLKYPRLRSLIK